MCLHSPSIFTVFTSFDVYHCTAIIYKYCFFIVVSKIFTYLVRGLRYCDWFVQTVCLFVPLFLSLSVQMDVSGSTCSVFAKFFMHVPRDRGSVLIW